MPLPAERGHTFRHTILALYTSIYFSENLMCGGVWWGKGVDLLHGELRDEGHGFPGSLFDPGLVVVHTLRHLHIVEGR